MPPYTATKKCVRLIVVLAIALIFMSAIAISQYFKPPCYITISRVPAKKVDLQKEIQKNKIKSGEIK